MCGITGIVNINDASVIQKMTKRISHRGPDNHSTFTFNNISLGHVRLAIQDISESANQPFISDDGRYVLIYNGELYNHEEIRKPLLNKYNFKTNCDTETLLYAFIEYGEELFTLLNGIFAFCILDKRKNELTLARDKMGVKPLYIYQKGNVFSFSSEIKSFLEIPNFDKSINHQALAYYMQYQYCPSQETPFQRVNKLEKGTYLTFQLNSGEIEINKFYSSSFYEKENETIKAKKILDETLSSSIKGQHLSDVSVGYLLSGGLDSSSIIHYSKTINNKLKAFTVNDQNSNESEGFESDVFYSKLVAEKYEVDLSIAKPIENLRDNLDKIIYHLDEPIGDTSVISLFKICENVKKEGYKVLLSGLGADDIFSGYRRHQALSYQKYKNIFKVIPEYILPSNLKRRIEKFKGEVPSYYSWLQSSKVNKLFHQDLRHNLNKNSPIDESWKNKTDLNDLNKMLNIEQEYYLPHNNLLYTDKIGMAFGIEIRVPFLDSQIVDFANHLSSDLKLKSFNTKFILKETMQNKLPSEIINRKKTGFGFPIRNIIKNDSEQLIKNYLLEGNFFNRGVFKKEEVLKLIKENKMGKIDASYSIWTLICIESWFRQFVD